MKKLIITEKPSVARDIARVLNIRAKKDGYFDSENYSITWAVGHLITLCEPDDYDDAYKKWNYEMLPIIPEQIKTKPYPKTEKQLKIIKKLCKSKDINSIVCATDSGREGELIFRYIYNYIGCKKPFERLWISSMTDEAITNGFDNLKDGKEYNRLYLSARCRSEADWLVGINATRAYTTLNRTLLSIGRVQTPTLALVVNRYNEIQSFVPKDYFELHVEYDKDFKGLWFKKKLTENRFETIEQAKEVEAKVKDKTGVVTKVEKSNSSTKPPFLYDLTELQRDGNKMFGYTANQVLEYTQSLYERYKLVTYPRTDSRFLSDDMKSTVYETMNLINVAPYNRAIKNLFKEDKLELKFSSRIINNKKITDHHAIIPTKKSPMGVKLGKGEQDIYNIIVKRFIAVFYGDYKYSTTKITVVVENENFISKGKIVRDLGWKKLYKKASSMEEAILPDIKKNEEVVITQTEIKSKKTQPPKLYTDATLLGAMENAGKFVEDEDLKGQLKEAGFGTPATRAGIIERLIKVNYIYRQKKAILPTPKGIKLISIIPKQLKSPDMTGRWERGLTKISKDELDTDIFMNSINKFVRYLVASARKTVGMVHFEEERYKKNAKKYSK